MFSETLESIKQHAGDSFVGVFLMQCMAGFVSLFDHISANNVDDALKISIHSISLIIGLVTLVAMFKKPKKNGNKTDKEI